ncbi:hypothetical protein D3C87_1543700 [compost metagenome]
MDILRWPGGFLRHWFRLCVFLDRYHPSDASRREWPALGSRLRLQWHDKQRHLFGERDPRSAAGRRKHDPPDGERLFGAEYRLSGNPQCRSEHDRDPGGKPCDPGRQQFQRRDKSADQSVKHACERNLPIWRRRRILSRLGAECRCAGVDDIRRSRFRHLFVHGHLCQRRHNKPAVEAL